MRFSTFLVGGALRDEVLGRPCKDFDFTVEAPSFDTMREMVEDEGGRVFTENPEFVTLRAKDTRGTLTGTVGMTADFVLARADGPSTDGRRPDFVVAGTLAQDLSRRDFTMNALARNVETGEEVDLFGGRDDLARKVVRAVGNAADRFAEDALRSMRALRFAVVLGFDLDPAVEWAMRDQDVDRLAATSVERKRDEMAKAFRADKWRTMSLLLDLPKDVREAMMPEALRLEPTLRK